MRLGIPGAIMNSRYLGGQDERAIGREDLRDLGVNLSRLPTVTPEQTATVTDRATGLPAEGPPAYVAPKSATLENIGTSTQQGGTPGTNWWQAAGYPDAATAIMSGNFRYDMNTGWQLKPGAATPAMELAEPVTPEQAFVAPPEVIQSAIENLPVTIGAMTSPTLGPLGTSGMSVFEGEPMTMTSESTMSPMIDPEVTPMDSDIDRAIAAALSGAENPVLNVDKAVEAAVGNGQPTTDDTILDLDDMVVGAMVVTPYYNPATGETFDQTNTAQPVPEGFIPVPEGGIPAKTETPAQPDFMTQLQELIAQMQAEQTTAAEQAAAAEQQRQEQVAAMTQNYMVGQPAVGYNPYESGQYQSDPYGSAGVPDMGGITSIPVPAAYNPNPYPIGGMT